VNGHPTCSVCTGINFKLIIGGNGKMRCEKCGNLVVIRDGKAVDAIAWTAAGRKRGGR
jgi:hypothetical protein